MATLSNNAIARAAYQAFGGKNPSEQSAVAKNFVRFLAKKRILSKSRDILDELTKIINQEEGRVEAKITSARPLEDKTKTHLEHAIKKRYAAREVAFITSVDERMLGGVKIEVNNEVIDLSLKNKVGKLQEHLTKSA